MLIFKLFFVHLKKRLDMDTIKLLNYNVDRLCNEKGWSHKRLAKEMGIMEAALSRALSRNPQLNTIEKMAKALDVSIKSLFENPNDIEGFILLNGKPYHFNSQEELSSIENRTTKSFKVVLQ